MIQRVAITSREQWLAERGRDVTASVIGALRGLHPYTSRLKLYKQHTGFEFQTEENVRMRRGSLFERAVADRVAQERPEWTIRPAGEYLRDPSLRLGASPDFYIDGDPRGPGILQTKLSIAGVFEREWRSEDGAVMPPMWIRLQALTEAMLHGAAFGAIACYIDHPFRDDIHIIEFDRHEAAEAAIRADVAQFWQDVEWRIEPEPSAVDADLVQLLYPESNPALCLDLTGDNYLTDALAERVRLKAEIAERARRIDEIEAELKGKLRDAEQARLNGFVVTFKTFDRTTKATFVDRVTRHRRLHITDLRPKEEIRADGKQAGY